MISMCSLGPLFRMCVVLGIIGLCAQGQAGAIVQEGVLFEATCPGPDKVGWSVALSGNWAILGAEFEDGGLPQKQNVGGSCDNSAFNAGAAYLYSWSVANGWVQFPESQGGYLKAFDPLMGGASIVAGDQFGRSVAIDGDRLVVGAVGVDLTGVPTAGAAFVYFFDGTSWIPEARLTSPSASNSELFGKAVAISGDQIVVGAYASHTQAAEAGAAYVFERSGSTWAHAATLVSPTPVMNGWFGYAVDCDASTVVVSALQEDELSVPVAQAGVAHVFVESGGVWGVQATLSAGTWADSQDRFGYDVKLYDDTIWVGAPWEDSASAGVGGSQGNGSLNLFSDYGAVYSFTRSAGSWSMEAYIKPKSSVGGGGATALRARIARWTRVSPPRGRRWAVENPFRGQRPAFGAELST